MSEQSNQKMNEAFRIPIKQLEDLVETKLNGESQGYYLVIPLRSMEKVDDIRSVKTEVMEKIIRHIPLRGTGEGPVVYPYKDAEINIYGREPKGLNIGQRFVLTSKVLGIMENLNTRIFKGFEVKGISKMPPAWVYGSTASGERAVSLYIPPIVELHGSHAVLIDGIHRSYVCKAAGTTVNAVHISNVSAQLPFEQTTWKEAPLVVEKPAVEQRYFGLRKDLFRNLQRVGVDG